MDLFHQAEAATNFAETGNLPSQSCLSWEMFFLLLAKELKSIVYAFQEIRIPPCSVNVGIIGIFAYTANNNVLSLCINST